MDHHIWPGQSAAVVRSPCWLQPEERCRQGGMGLPDARCKVKRVKALVGVLSWKKEGRRRRGLTPPRHHFPPIMCVNAGWIGRRGVGVVGVAVHAAMRETGWAGMGRPGAVIGPVIAARPDMPGGPVMDKCASDLQLVGQEAKM
jgi:hypothetical protein